MGVPNLGALKRHNLLQSQLKIINLFEICKATRTHAQTQRRVFNKLVSLRKENKITISRLAIANYLWKIVHYTGYTVFSAHMSLRVQ